MYTKNSNTSWGGGAYINGEVYMVLDQESHFAEDGTSQIHLEIQEILKNSSASLQEDSKPHTKNVKGLWVANNFVKKKKKLDNRNDLISNITIKRKYSRLRGLTVHGNPEITQMEESTKRTHASAPHCGMREGGQSFQKMVLEQRDIYPGEKKM